MSALGAQEYYLKNFDGDKYNGNTHDYEAWEDNITSILGCLGLTQCLHDENFYGVTKSGTILLGKLQESDKEDQGVEPVNKRHIDLGIDIQTKLGCWLKQTVDGAPLNKVRALENQLKINKQAGNPDGPRQNSDKPSAYAVFKSIKEDVNPEECIELEAHLIQTLQTRPFPKTGGRKSVQEWLDAQLNTRNDLIIRNKESGMKDDNLFVQQMLNLIRPVLSAESYNALTSGSKGGAEKKKYIESNFRTALLELYPICYDVQEGRYAITFAANTLTCTICGKRGHSAEKCYRNPTAICEICNQKGHTKQICPTKKKDAREPTKKQQKKKDEKKEKRKQKKTEEKRLIALARSHGLDSSSPPPLQPHLPAGAPAAAGAPATSPPQLQLFELDGRQYYARGSQLHLLQSAPYVPQVPEIALLPSRKQGGSIQLMQKTSASIIMDRVNAPHEPESDKGHIKQLLPDPNEISMELDRDFEQEHALPAEYLSSGADAEMKGRTVMLCRTGAPPSSDWVTAYGLIDTGAQITGTTLPGAIHSPTATAGPTGGVGGSSQPTATGTLTVMFGDHQYFNIDQSNQYPPGGLSTQQLIFSEGQLKELGIQADSLNDQLILPDGTIIPTKTQDRLWYIECYVWAGKGPPPRACYASMFASGAPTTLSEVRDMLGCPSEENLRKTLPLVHGLDPKLKDQTLDHSDIVPKAKDTRQPIERDPNVPKREYEVHQAVGMDLSAKQPLGIRGAQYFQLIVDIASLYMTPQLLALKSDAVEAFREYCVKNGPPEIAQTDGDGVYENDDFNGFCAALNIFHRFSAPDTQAQNYIAENGMRLIYPAARANLLRLPDWIDKPLALWEDAIIDAADGVNQRFNAGVSSGVTPYEAFHGRPPDLSHRRVFGTVVNVLVHHPDHKFSPRTITGIYVRQAMNYKAWQVYLPSTGGYVISKHVTFNPLPGDVHKMALHIEKWCQEAMKSFQLDADGELYDAKRHLRDAMQTGKAPPERQLVVSPLPPRAEQKDLTSKPSKKGKQGAHEPWMEFLQMRIRDMEIANYPDASKKTASQLYQERQKIISAEWKLLKKGKKPAPIEGVAEIPKGFYPGWKEPAKVRQSKFPKPAPDEGGVVLEESEDETLPQDEKSLEEVVEIEAQAEEEVGIKGEQDEMGNAEPPPLFSPETEKQLKELDEEAGEDKDIRHNDGESTFIEGHSIRDVRSESINHFKTTEFQRTHAVTQVIYALENTDGPIHQGNLNELEWEILMAVLESVESPKTVHQALNGKYANEWRKAIQEELQSLLDLEVYQEIKRDQVPKGKKILLSKIVLKYKEYERRFKARLVVLGFMQPDEDAGETFAPVAKFTTFRLLMAIACALDLEISSSDVKTAFLNAILDEAIYIYPPRGMGYPPDTVWKLHKNLYGLKGAPRGWNLTLHAVMLELGFVPSIFDPCLYFIEGLWVLVWVDDTLKVGTPEAIAWFEEELNKRFTMTHVAKCEMFVGIEINRDREEGTLELTQTAYIDKILEHHGMQDCKPKPIPMQENTKVSREDCCQGNPDLIKEYNAEGVNYPSGAAELLYLALCTRPDMAFVAKELCKVMSDPGPKHIPVLKYAMKYAKNTRNLGLKFTKQGILDSLSLDLVLKGWADSSFGDDPDTKRSTQGFVAKLCGGAVSWFSQGQKSTSLSTAEAELICLADALKEILYMRDAMKFFGAEQEGPTVIFEDNQAVVATAHNPGKNHGKLKHVAIRSHRVQEEVRLETIDVVYKETSLMLADILTKALGRSQFQTLSHAILGYTKLEDGH